MRPHNKKKLIWFLAVCIFIGIIIILGTKKIEIEKQDREIILNPENWEY